MTNVTRVGIEATFEFISPSGQPVPVPVELGYRADDPFAVAMTFRMCDDVTTWLVSRDLLADGLIEATGAGDVRLRPRSVRTAVLELWSDEEYAVFHVPVGQLQEFLNATYDVVLPGMEPDHLDLDATLRTLLA